MARVPAPDVEEAVCSALRQHRPALNNLDDRALVELGVERIVVARADLRIKLGLDDVAEGEESGANQDAQPDTIIVPFATRSPARKGYVHQPQSRAEKTAEARDALLRAIARTRRWLDDILSGAATSFDEIATREGLVERHVRFLMPLAFVAPQDHRGDCRRRRASGSHSKSSGAERSQQLGRSGPGNSRLLNYSPLTYQRTRDASSCVAQPVPG